MKWFHAIFPFPVTGNAVESFDSLGWKLNGLFGDVKKPRSVGQTFPSGGADIRFPVGQTFAPRWGRHSCLPRVPRDMHIRTAWKAVADKNVCPTRKAFSNATQCDRKKAKRSSESVEPRAITSDPVIL